MREILAFNRIGNGRVQHQRRAERFVNGGFEGANDFGDVLGDGCKQLVVTSLDSIITRYDVVPA